MSKTLAALAVSLVAAGPAGASATWVARTGPQGVPLDAVVGGWDSTVNLQYLCRGSCGGQEISLSSYRR